MKRASDRSGRGAAALAGRPRRRPAEAALPHGDPERLGALLTSLEPRLNAVALRFTRDPEVARDVVHPCVPQNSLNLRNYMRGSEKKELN